MKRNSVAKYLAIIFLTVLVIPGILQNGQMSAINNQPSETYESSAFTSKVILFDESHCDNGSSLWAPGNASMFSWILDVNGYESDTNFNESLDSGILNNYDILALFFPVIPLTGGEISAILSFVDNGGGLLLVGADSNNWWEFRGTNLNPISSTFGITFEMNTLDEMITTFGVHNVTYSVTTLNTEGDDIRSTTMAVTSPAQAIVNASLGPFVAVAEPGLGKVVCVGGPGPFYMYRKNSAGFGDSQMQFSVNVIDWLAGNPARVIDIPEIATITVGAGPDLSPSEVESYGMFVGSIHDHTTHSDGANTPQEMLEKALRIKDDYFVMSDHSYGTPAATGGITGALAMRSIAEANYLDMPVMIGAELSSVKHTLGFPLTENIFTADQQEAVDEIHAQGAFAGLCHPTIEFSYAPTYEARNEIGYDAVEVNNRGFFFGAGEDGFTDCFYAAADTHSALEDGCVNAVFVQNPSGPNGRVTAEDVIDAILNKRIVAIDPYNDMIYGQEVWVNRYYEIQEEAETAIADGLDLIQSLRDAGQDVDLSAFYLEEATLCLEHWNPARALRFALNATSDVVLGINFEITEPTYMEPNGNYEAMMTLKNNHTHGVAINTRAFIRVGLAFDNPDYEIIADGETTTVVNRSYQTDEYGLIIYGMNLYSFNTTEFINPIVIPMRGIVENVSYVVTEDEEGYLVDTTFWMGRASGKEIRNVHMIYDDGSGAIDVAMDRGWDQFLYSIGPFDPGTELDVHLVVTTYEGAVYTVGEDVLTLGTATTTTTTTTTTSTTTTSTTTTTNTTSGGGTPLNTTLLIIIAGAGIGVVVIVLVIVKLKK